ncbi:hypothetical protein JN01_0444 [Entomoplasma freundtii]|uniref:Uncharacterized protein n=1 Tax=Entomoplasma freundtii TaxID=74700 RepID=A0A2K8NRJ6_9MOLU|nr:hypothetical protein [Entomoplasma freundtii]ATZ16156.1 hypothetical protein EFREU_v1c01290 [Entomoplasma freundtii]TDY56943.1 hypothetical protein JN01_0444 [Entomoplasma freundtii]
MTKLLLLLTASLGPAQIVPLLVTNNQHQNQIADDTPFQDSQLNVYTTKMESGIVNSIAASLNNLFRHKNSFSNSQMEIQQKLQEITGNSKEINLSGYEKQVEEWINDLGDYTRYFTFGVEKVSVDLLTDENLAKTLLYSIGWKRQPIILQSKSTSFLVMGYMHNTLFVTNHDNYDRVYLDSDQVIKELLSDEGNEIFIIADKNALRTLKGQPRVADEIALIKQETSYYHFTAALLSLLKGYHKTGNQTEVYKWLRQITNTPDDVEGIVIRDQEISDIINSQTSANFGTFNLGEGFGIMRDEIVAFNKSIEESLNKGNPLILTNQAHSFVISEITINQEDPWKTMITGMNPEKGEMVTVSCQRLTWFNRENSYLIGEKEAISQNINIKNTEVAIEQKVVEMSNLEGGLDTIAFESQINLTTLTSIPDVPKIKQKIVSFELPDFSAQIFKINGSTEEKRGLTIETTNFPDADVEHWKSETKQVFDFEDRTSKEKIRTWVKYRVIINQDWLGDLTLTIQVLVGAEVTINGVHHDNEQRLLGKVTLDSGKIVKLNRQ